jgi:hypothetical protein
LIGRLKTWLGGFRAAYLPILVTYFCYGASSVTAVALLYFEKDTLKLTPAEAAGIAFWLGLPWSMKMVAGVASDVYPIAFWGRCAPWRGTRGWPGPCKARPPTWPRPFWSPSA